MQGGIERGHMLQTFRADANILYSHQQLLQYAIITSILKQTNQAHNQTKHTNKPKINNNLSQEKKKNPQTYKI